MYRSGIRFGLRPGGFGTVPLVLAGVTVWFAAGQGTLAQTSDAVQPSHAQEPATVIQADTHAVVVDVVVTQGHDEPVAALHKQDFELTEDGKRQSIDFFEEHSAPASRLNALAPVPKMPPNVYTNVPPAPLSDSVNVLLLDSLNTPRPDQSYVHQQILAFLRTMKPDARIAIFTLGSKLRFVQGFTDDPAVLRAALNDPAKGFHPETTNVSRTRQDDADDKREIEAKEEAFGGGTRASGTAGVAAVSMSQADYAYFEADQRITITLDALQKLGRYLAGIPGRKNLIWFASSYPVDIFPHGAEKQPFNNHREFTNEIMATADLLTLSKVAVYPVSAEGMMNDHGMESDSYQKPSMADFQNEATERSVKMSAMEQLASDTGGEAVFNTNDLNTALNQVIHNGGHYYTIVYTPTHKEMNGQFRSIRVKLNGVKAKLSYRRGYYADEAGGKSGNAGKSAAMNVKVSAGTAERARVDGDPLSGLMTRGVPSATQILYGVRVEPAVPLPNGRRAGANDKLTGPTTRYTADFLIDWKMVQLQAMPNGNHSGKVRVELLAYDHDGNALNWSGSVMNLSIRPDTYAAIQRSGLPAHVEIDVPVKMDVYLATGIYDLNTNKAGTLEIPLGWVEEVAGLAQMTPKAQ